MRRLLIILTVTWAAFAGTVGAATVVGNITADNHYGLYVGNADGSRLTLIGRNEYGELSADGTYQWQTPERWEFDVWTGAYIYVLAWDESACCRMWIGAFSGLPGGVLVSNTTDWQHLALANSLNPGSLGDLPSTASIQDWIAGAAWSSGGDSSQSRFGPFPTIDSRALQIWHDTINGPSSNPSFDSFAIYRAEAIGNLSELPVREIPEPTSMSLAAVCIVGLLWARKRSPRRWCFQYQQNRTLPPPSLCP